MRAASLFTGIGGLDYGLQLAGIETVLQVENDRSCNAVLEHHFPEVPRLDDVRKVHAATFARGGRNLARANGRSDAERPRPPLPGRGDTVGPVDCIHGGFPCQDVSVAGQRRGLSGERSGLWFEFERILREVRPRWCVIENVPGLFSSNRGGDFGLILRALVECGYGVAWRTLDAQFFGTPQRRRRVLLVGCLGNHAAAGQVLAVCEGCDGDPAPRRKPKEDLAYTLAGGAPETSRRISNAWNTTYLPAPGPAEFRDGVGTLAFGGNNTRGPIDVATARSSRANRYDFETDTFLVSGTLTFAGGKSAGSATQQDAESGLLVANTVRGADGHHGHSSPRGDGADNLVVADPISASEGRTQSNHEGRLHNVVDGVRRLTPLECERLQGFPDGWTDLPGMVDSHRYRMLGNAVDTVVAQWLGHRLLWVDHNLPATVPSWTLLRRSSVSRILTISNPFLRRDA